MYPLMCFQWIFACWKKSPPKFHSAVNLRGAICADNRNYRKQRQGFGCIFYRFRLLIEMRIIGILNI